MSAKVAVVVFPGSNCDRDTYYVIESILKKPVAYHWYDQPVNGDYAAVILPGGFSYGDYLRAGALAKISRAVDSLGSYIEKGGMVLGICNGFQILVEAGLLPGTLVKNQSLRFQCHDVFMRVESTRSPFLSETEKGKVLRMPIAHSEGRYYVTDDERKALEKAGQIALRYCSPEGDTSPAYNANGSVDSIAGVTNAKGNVLGLMPHPERCAEEILANTDGLAVFRSIEKFL